jgi:ribonuclease MRP protein subunit SNM1
MHLKYMNDAAHLLANGGPATSAYLMSRCNGLMFDNSLEATEAHRQRACGACGNIMVTSWTNSQELDAPIYKRRRRDAAEPSKPRERREKVITCSCERCGRKTRRSFTARPRRAPKGPDRGADLVETNPAAGLSQNKSSSEPNAINTPATSALNANSKRRAKARKQGGLQALLAAAKDTGSRTAGGDFGLDLLDLMKRS